MEEETIGKFRITESSLKTLTKKNQLLIVSFTAPSFAEIKN